MNFLYYTPMACCLSLSCTYLFASEIDSYVNEKQTENSELAFIVANEAGTKSYPTLEKKDLKLVTQRLDKLSTDLK